MYVAYRAWERAKRIADRGSSVPSSSAAIMGVGSPEGVVTGNAEGHMYVEKDALGNLVNLWFFDGTPGTKIGWKTFQ